MDLQIWNVWWIVVSYNMDCGKFVFFSNPWSFSSHLSPDFDEENFDPREQILPTMGGCGSAVP